MTRHGSRRIRLDQPSSSRSFIQLFVGMKESGSPILLLLLLPVSSFQLSKLMLDLSLTGDRQLFYFLRLLHQHAASTTASSFSSKSFANGFLLLSIFLYFYYYLSQSDSSVSLSELIYPLLSLDKLCGFKILCGSKAVSFLNTKKRIKF